MKDEDLAKYYDDCDILEEFTDDEVAFSLEGTLLQEIKSGSRKRRLQNVTLKLDPLQVQAIRKLATMKSMPYQTLIRTWLARDIKRELAEVS